MAMKWSAVCLVAVAMTGCLCDDRWSKPETPPAKPVRPPTRPKKPDSPTFQSKQKFEVQMSWAFPEDPQPEPKPDVTVDLRQPVPAVTVRAQCREDMILVEVQRDMFGTGQLIQTADLTLGTCAAAGEDAQMLTYQSELQGCGSQLLVSNDFLIYTFTLNYRPTPIGGSAVVRTSVAAVNVECHYPRKHNVSSNPLNPDWIPFSATKMAEEFLYFTLKIMTDDFKFERPIITYFLGQMINIEVAVIQYFHVPLRVFVDRCVATVTPDVNSSPRYGFIENHGCLIDAKVTGSSSQFLSRIAENKLQFQLEAFRFQENPTGFIYITCNVKALAVASPINEEQKACSYLNGWREVGGVDGACGCCDNSCGQGTGTGGGGTGSGGGGGTGSGGGGGKGSGSGQKKRPGRDVSTDTYVQWDGQVSIGPLSIQEKIEEY